MPKNLIKNALLFVLERMKRLIESSAASSIAAVMTNKASLHGKNVCCVILGGNIALDKLGEIIGVERV
ncbi:hypothetical protein [Lentibacillus halodurans]|uniref:hypothetical protein n=1 Tax=Lentibacillus halodurans TaxID=237679 RepID=UPI000B7F2717|nr:hypothetical protein [Lentibacillus halodurans]